LIVAKRLAETTREVISECLEIFETRKITESLPKVVFILGATTAEGNLILG